MNKNGSMLLVVLGAVATIVVTIAALFERTAMFRAMSSYAVKQAQARELALSGVQQAIALIESALDQKEASSDVSRSAADKTSDEQGKGAWLAPVKIMSLLYRWHDHKTDPEQDGVVGAWHFYISSEEGKININSFYDSVRNEWRNTPLDANGRDQLSASLAREIKIEKIIERCGTLIKKRKKLFEDVSELLDDREVADTKPALYPLYGEKSSLQRPPALTNFFTTVSRSSQVSYLLATPSVLNLVGLKLPKEEERNERFTELSAALKAKNTDEALAKFYGPLYSNVPESLKKIFTTTFDPQYLTVVSCGEFGTVQQQVIVVLERVDQNYLISKLYWM